jgi:uncharacterized membrane protein YoaK (UPF0700 family)
VTGNFAALAVAIVGPRSAVLLRVVVIAAFGVGAIIAGLLTQRLTAFEPIIRRSLLVELAMLAAVLAAHVAFGGLPSEKPWVAIFAAAAMGAQSALSKIPQGLSSPTTVMTSNYTQWAISLVNVLAPLDAESGRAARAHLARMSMLLLAFVPGAFAGAYGEARFGRRFSSSLAPWRLLSSLMAGEVSKRRSLSSHTNGSASSLPGTLL